MISIIKKVAKGVLPNKIIKKSTSTINNYKLRKAVQAFEESATEPSYLPAEKLPELFKKYKFEAAYLYDPESIKQRGIQRANEITSMIEKLPEKLQDFLELGCGDGMVSGILQDKGKNCTAIDFFDGGFDERARISGVKFHKMDAAQMTLKDESFDFIFSYNSYEHFPKPDKVFEESLRVLRHGGYMFIEFAPLFMSSYGLHAYKSIPVPYCQHLFTESDMARFTQEKNIPSISFVNHVNRWSLDNFRKLWKDHDSEIEAVKYEELKSYIDLNLIWKYPSCFKSKTSNFDNLLVGGIRALFKKK